MPIDPKEGLSYLGFDPEAFEDLDAFKASADTTYVRRELAHADKEITNKVFGKVNGTLRNNLKGVAKDLGIEGIDFESIDPTEGIKSLAKSFKDNITKTSGEIEALKKAGGSSKDIAELQGKFEAQGREVEALRKNASEWEAKYTELDGVVKKREATAKEDAYYEEAFSGIKWNENVSAFAKDGFKSAFRTQYKPEYFDGGVRTLDKDGNIVMDPSKAQTYRSHKDIASEWADKEKLTGSATAAAPVRKVVSTTSAGLGTTPATTAPPAQPGRSQRRVMPMS